MRASKRQNLSHGSPEKDGQWLLNLSELMMIIVDYSTQYIGIIIMGSWEGDFPKMAVLDVEDGSSQECIGVQVGRIRRMEWLTVDLTWAFSCIQ